MRGIPSADNLAADVEGDIEDTNGVLRITRIRLRYRFKVPPGTREKVDRLLAGYAEQCPAYHYPCAAEGPPTVPARSRSALLG